MSEGGGDSKDLTIEISLHAFDYVVICGYFVVVFAIGILVAKRTKSQEDLFLGGRSFTWPFIGLSLFASNISSSTLIGLAGSAYTSGIANSVYEWGTGVPMTIFALWFVPLYLDSQITTIPEFLEFRYNRPTRIMFSLVTILISIVVDTAGGLYAGAVTVRTFLPNLNIWVTSIVLAVVAGFYTAFGGLAAVVYTDAIQAIILILGGMVLTFNLFKQPSLEFSLSKLIESAPPGHFSIYKGLDDENLPWPALLAAVPMLGFWYFATNQYIAQRVLGSKSVNHARWGLIATGFLKFLPLFIMVVPGAMMISVVPGLPVPDAVFPTAVTRFLPVGMVGLVLAGLIAAIMSSVDSTLNSASTLVVHDFVVPHWPKWSDRRLVFVGRVTTFLFMTFAAVWAPIIENFDNIWEYLQSVYAVIVPPAVVLFSVGLIDWRGNGTGAMAVWIVGILLGLPLFILSVLEIWTLHFTYNIVICFVVCSIVFVVVSRLAGEPPARHAIEPYMLKASQISQGTKGIPWYLDYRVHIGALLVGVGAHYVLLRA